MINLIDKKRLKEELTKEEINHIVSGYVSGEIPDYQMSSFLMAVTLNGLTDDETIYFTDALIKSGDVLSFDGYNLVDKHSTGGVGDKTTLIIAPILASCGLNMVKMSGRGLGHTGGTIDKLESIAGFKVELKKEKVEKLLKEVGVCLISQMGNIVPADKKIYSLRDVTATTNSIPLIASSIMSKKIASGAKTLVIDLKVGKGAFMKNMDDARELARIMKKIGSNYKVDTVCVLSNMDQPLGRNIGNGLEIQECLDFFDNPSPDLYELVVEICSILISSVKKISIGLAKNEVIAAIETDSAYNHLLSIVKKQGGKIDEIDISDKKQKVISPVSGYIAEIDSLKIGELVKKLGGGRTNIKEKIDYGVGFVLEKKVGDFIEKKESLLTVYYGQKDIQIKEIISCFKFSEKKVEKPQLIYEII